MCRLKWLSISIRGNAIQVKVINIIGQTRGEQSSEPGRTAPIILSIKIQHTPLVLYTYWRRGGFIHQSSLTYNIDNWVDRKIGLYDVKFFGRRKLDQRMEITTPREVGVY